MEAFEGAGVPQGCGAFFGFEVVHGKSGPAPGDVGVCDCRRAGCGGTLRKFCLKIFEVPKKEL